MIFGQHGLVEISSLTTFSISITCKKPLGMRYDDYVGDCCRSLAEINGAPTDADLIHFIDLKRLAEEIANTFGYNSSNNVGHYLRMDNVELSVKAFESRLHDLRRSFPSNSTCLCKKHSISLVSTPG